MLRVCGKPLQTVDNKLAETADVLVFRRQHPDGSGFRIECGLRLVPQCGLRQIPLVGEDSQKLFLCGERHANCIYNRFPVEIRIGDCPEKIDRDQMINLSGDRFSFPAQSGRHRGKPFRNIHQQILHRRNFRFLAAHSADRATLASGGLLTLITKHFGFHRCSPCCWLRLFVWNSWIWTEYGLHALQELFEFFPQIEGSVGHTPLLDEQPQRTEDHAEQRIHRDVIPDFSFAYGFFEMLQHRFVVPLHHPEEHLLNFRVLLKQLLGKKNTGKIGLGQHQLHAML